MAVAAGAVVTLTGVRVAYDGRTVLDVPALAVHEGETLAVIGPNGAGKSTLLRVLGAVEAPTAGEVRFRGARVTPRDGLAVRRRMASVFQEPLLTDATVFDNVALGLAFRGVGRAAGAGRVARWLDRFGIAHLAARRSRTLSGGEAQRTALARALVLEPEVLLLDEPFSSLDQPTREGVIDDHGRVLRAERVTTVLITHDRDEAMALGDQVGVLMDGRMLQVGESAQVFRAPVSEEVARFVGVETIVDGRVADRAGPIALVEAAGRAIQVAQPVPPDERVRLCLRPEDVSLFPGDPKPGSPGDFNRLAGRVVRLVPAGAWIRVTVDCGFPLVALVSGRSAQEMALASGMAVTAHFKATAPHLLPGR